MKPLIYLLILSFVLTAQKPSITTSENCITLHCKTPTLKEEPSDQQLFGERCVTLSTKGALVEQIPGSPEVPYFSHRLILPYGKEVDTILFNGEFSDTFSLSGPLSYALRPFPTKEEIGKTEINRQAYSEQQGIQKPQIISIQTQHGISILTISSHPIRYNPIRNSIDIAKEYDLHIQLKDKKRAQINPSYPDRLPIEREVLNVGVIDSYPQSSKREEQYDWLAIGDIFITTSQAMTKLVQHREAQGLTCKVVDVATIGTTAQEIRTFIRNEYLTHGIKYVLLAGDETTIPPFRVNVYQGAAIKMDTITTDVPFQCLDDNNWEKVYYDEPAYADYSAEVNIGRILCSDMFDFIYQTEKILTYEQLDGSEQALKTFLGLSQKMDEDDWGKTFIEKTHSIIPDFITKELLCEKDGMWYDDDYIALINANRFTVVNHKGHANSGYIMKLMGAGALTNEIPLFVKSQGCHPAAFHQSSETITEKLTTAPHGFFAATLNTHYGWYNGNGKGSSQTMTEHFWKGHFQEGIRTFSGMTEYSHRRCMEHSSWDLIYLWDMLCSNYFGDPATECRTPKGAESISKKRDDYMKNESSYQFVQMGNKLSFKIHDKLSISLFNAQGRMIYSTILSSMNSNHSIDLSGNNIAPGVYLLQIKSNGVHNSMRIVL